MDYRLGNTSSQPAQKDNAYSGIDLGGYLSANNAGARATDYSALARQIYEPSLDYLDSQSAAAKKRNAANDASLAQMFGAGVKDIRGQSKGIKKNYQDIIAQIANGTGAAVGAIDNTYDESANEQMEMLKHLGIQAAAPDTLKQNTRDEAFFKNLASSSGKSVADMLGANEASALDFNTAQGNITQQSGLDARANNKLSLEDTLNQIMGQRSGLETQINQDAQKMQESATDTLLKNMQMQQDQANKDRDYELQAADRQLNLAKFQTDTKGAQQKGMDPMGIMSLAAQLYPNPQAQGNAVKAIQDTLARGNFPMGKPQSAIEFIRAVLDRNKGANDANQLQQLAAAAYQSLFGK
jgi:hypothetical protein